MRKIAIIPARGGSKRIPGKNIKPFAGKPLIAYSIEAALQSNLFEKVIVSTDSDEIAEVALKFGAEVPFLRSKGLAGDFTGTDDVVLDALRRMEDKVGVIDYVCCIYATAPFVRSEDLKTGLDILCSNNAYSAFSVTTYPAPIFRSLKINKENRLEMIWPEYKMARSQDLPEAYHDAGQFYWADAQRFLRLGTFWSYDTLPIRISRHRVQDIDTMEDWVSAEKMFEVLKMNS